MLVLSGEKGFDCKMRNRIIRVLAIALVLTVLFLTLKIGPVHTFVQGTLRIVGPGTGNYADLFSALTNSISYDQIHVLAGHTETWTQTQDLIIGFPLWIIGSPLGTVAPVIDMGRHEIHISAPYVFIWGLDIINSGGIFLDPGSHDCMIWNNTIQTVSAATYGIYAQTDTNIIALNYMVHGPSQFTYTHIFLDSASSSHNTIEYNTLKDEYSHGIAVSTGGIPGAGARSNYVYWNNIMSTNPTSYALWDDNLIAGSPPNWFDDTTAVSWTPHKGNYEANIPHGGVIFPYNVPGPGANGYADNHPLAAPVSPLLGDINLDGKVGLADLVLVAQHFGLQWPGTNLTPVIVPPAPGANEWDPRADVAAPRGVVGLSDLVTVAVHWGQYDP